MIEYIVLTDVCQYLRCNYVDVVSYIKLYFMLTYLKFLRQGRIYTYIYSVCIYIYLFMTISTLFNVK